MDLTVTVGKLFALRARPWFAARCVFGRVAKHPWRVGASDRWWSGWTGCEVCLGQWTLRWHLPGWL